MNVRRCIAMLGALVLSACASSGSDETSDGTDVTDTAVVADETFTTSGEPVTDESVVSTTELDGATHPPVRTRTDDAVGDGVQPLGVGTVTARVTAADGSTCDVCLWLASTSAQRSTGLMGVDDLGEPVGMAFVWDDATAGNFVMIDTPTPLSIAWFRTDGSHLFQTDMEPCLIADTAACERYGPGAQYQLAIEMFQGELGVIGIGPGSSVELLAGTESPTCLVTR